MQRRPTYDTAYQERLAIAYAAIRDNQRLTLEQKLRQANELITPLINDANSFFEYELKQAQQEAKAPESPQRAPPIPRVTTPERQKAELALASLAVARAGAIQVDNGAQPEVLSSPPQVPPQFVIFSKEEQDALEREAEAEREALAEGLRLRELEALELQKEKDEREAAQREADRLLAAQRVLDELAEKEREERAAIEQRVKILAEQQNKLLTPTQRENAYLKSLRVSDVNNPSPFIQLKTEEVKQLINAMLKGDGKKKGSKNEVFTTENIVVMFNNALADVGRALQDKEPLFVTLLAEKDPATPLSLRPIGQKMDIIFALYAKLLEYGLVKPITQDDDILLTAYYRYRGYKAFSELVDGVFRRIASNTQLSAAYADVSPGNSSITERIEMIKLDPTRLLKK